MKKLIAILLACIFALALFAACDGDTPATTGNNPTQPSTQPDSGGPAVQGLYFSPKGVKLEIGAAPAPALAALKEALGEPLSELPCPSCALKAMDIDYTYDGFKVTVTYPEEGDDYITTVKLSGDNYAIPGGISIGSTAEEVFAAYGTDYSEKNGHYYYTEGLGVLHLAIANGKVTQIAYEHVEFIEM